MKILTHFPTRTSFKKNSQSSNFLQNLFPPKASLVNAQQKKKTGKEKQKKRRGENAKGKRRGGSETFSKKNSKF